MIKNIIRDPQNSGYILALFAIIQGIKKLTSKDKLTDKERFELEVLRKEKQERMNKHNFPWNH